MSVEPARCRFCGARVLPGRDVCRAHEDVDDQISFCTRDAECTAAADMHESDCPVEIALKESIGF